MVAAMTYIVIDICWQGNGQYTYFLMAIFNILMFLGFGCLGMVSMYDKYNNKYIPWIKRELETNVKKVVKKAKGNSTKQRNASVDNNSGSDILEPLHSDGGNGAI